MYVLNHMDEKDLLMRLQQGDKTAFEALYHRYKTRLAANLFKLVKCEDIAQELLQEVFVKVWVKRENIDPEQSFRAYLFRIAQNGVYDLYRKASRNQKLEIRLAMVAAAGNYNPVEEAIYHRETASLLQHAIERLPPQCRRVFTLCKIKGKSYEEVSHLLGISTATVNNHIVKATRSIKKQLSYAENLSGPLLLTALLQGI